jgi:hypothetical protein
MSDHVAPVQYDEVCSNVVKYIKILTKVMKPDGTNFSRKVSRRFQLLFTELEIESILPELTLAAVALVFFLLLQYPYLGVAVFP